MKLPTQNNNKNSVSSKGFTLVELLLVIVIISTLATTVFVALNPSKRIKDSKDSRRTADIDSVLTAIHSSIVDNKGALPTGLTAGMAEAQLGTDLTGCALATNGCAATATACLDLSGATVLGKYLKSIPVDPDGTAGKTGYSVVVDANSIVTVKACNAEGGTNISVSR